MRKKIPLHTDAIQAPGALAIDVDALGIDLLSLSGHKFRGPKGTGILYMRRGTPFVTQLSGGGQERQRRAGTENVAGIVGQAEALRLAEEGRDEYTSACLTLRESIIGGVLERVEDAQLNGHTEERLANNVNISFRGARGDDLVAALDKAGIAASAGAACGSSTWEPSHVLLAMGLSMAEAVGSLRLSVSPDNTMDDVNELLRVLPGMVSELRRPVSSAH